jgi:LysM domain
MVNDTEKNIDKTIKIQACPFLGMAWDERIRYGYPHTLNYCFKPVKAQPVSLKHQELMCLGGRYLECPVFSQNFVVHLPEGIRSEEVNASKRRTRDKIIGITFLIITSVLFLWLMFWFITQRIYLGNPYYSYEFPTPDDNSVAPIFNFFLQDTLSPIPTSTVEENTPVPTLSSLSILKFTVTPAPIFTGTVAPTPEINSETPTFGPALETPFGLNNIYLVHQVKPGESLDYLSNFYKTSPIVIEKMNYLPYQKSIWVDQFLVIEPSQKDPTQVLPMKAIKLTEDTSVQNFVAANNLSETQFREINALQGNGITAGRWVVVPWGQ